ncbi:MAG: GNAT family N-acetyltransferase [Candidatus Aminicenantes bacterium]|nr:GNAT family N-acetyltransferase [Candidatus Aminicenantes bacterium]
MIQIKPVKGREDLKNFILFPWKIYSSDPNWVPPLIKEMKEKLDLKKNPFFEHASMELFLAVDKGEIVGRIAAIIDDLHNQIHNERVVFFGLYESINEEQVARALIEAAIDWGKSRGMNLLRGPMNLSMNDECAFLIEGFDSPPVIMMPYNPPYYNELMTKCGLIKAKDLFAYYMARNHETAAKIKTIVDRVKEETKFRLRLVDMKRLEEEARKIQQIYNDAWSRNWGFVPWTEKEMKHMVKRLKQFADPYLVILAEDQAGRPIGFAFGLPNYNEILKKLNGRLTPWGLALFLLNRRRIKGMRALVFGVVKDYQHTGISYWLYWQLEENALKRGYEWCEMSWLLEDNVPILRFCESIGGRLYKKYRIYQKEI